ncbi:putative anthocyanidin 5,3-O-glucosyltransferase-like [Capsicum annuum]|uniref:tRNA/rRNA methyltransferase SpoU type domain-containing protein n=1 Tax=Capsicum annuum TaxID=4072 RepID=A0A1U8FRI4_CAPAN|nr:tRNA (guanosine(18)-2'-O)-methyltransferase [Capsicum annuum]XP_047263479.1 tRNA (guanosine(18)-2'-O)-methyltransferase [Capsicum annuum]KAF3648682.1 putative anthocyanidin 5,3-O-glucosyltransferase-like [Capsicum annuum]PHT91918.1 hypothetical protein T459_07031 [Capsicum annuum]
MSVCKTLIRSSISLFEFQSRNSYRRIFSSHNSSNFSHFRRPLPLLSHNSAFRIEPCRAPSRRYGSSTQGTISLEMEIPDVAVEIPEEKSKDTVEELLCNRDDVLKLMKMERRLDIEGRGNRERWFPYLDKAKAGNDYLSSLEILEALNPYIMDSRKERFRNAVKHRTYSVCLVVEGLSDFGNVSATFRSADALGIQSVHVVACDSSKRYRENRHVSMGAEKWLDIELWDSVHECFKVLKSRGYRIATTHLGTDTVSVYDMDWSCPTAIVVGNELRGISEEALESSDLHCSIPMKGMVDSFNVSVAAGLLMHHAVCDRTSRLGCHGDLTSEESQILLAEFSLRHNDNTIRIAHEYAKRKIAEPKSKL